MPLALVLVMVDTILVVHAIRTGRVRPWAYVILALPGVGALAYLAVELVPAWLSTHRAARARRQIARALAPERRYRGLRDQLAMSNTIANRAALAAVCCDLDLFEEARRHYEDILAHPHGEVPNFMVGKARAEFGLGLYSQALATLDALKARWPHYESPDAHLLYARALEEGGREHEAVAEYDALARYHAGAEPRVRHALLLRKIGRTEEAQARLSYLLAEFRRAPKFVRKAQAEWLGLAAAVTRR